MVEPIGRKTAPTSAMGEEVVRVLARELNQEIENFKTSVQKLVNTPSLIDNPTYLEHIAKSIEKLDPLSKKAAALGG